MKKAVKFSEVLNPSERKKKTWKDLSLSLQLQWTFREECKDTFDFDLINETFSNALLKFHGLIGSAGYKIKIKQITKEIKTCDVVIFHKQLPGFWAAISQVGNRMGIDGLIDFKIEVSDIEFINENQDELTEN